MNIPLLSVIIPTRDRPHLLSKAVRSALAQKFTDLEVIVVDDGSIRPLEMQEEPRLRIIRLSKSQGVAHARNKGTEAAKGSWVTYLDDDDRLLPHMVETSLEALKQSSLHKPVSVISGLEVLNPDGKVIDRRFPPSLLPRGLHFFLEPLEPGKEFTTKQTLVVERELVLQIGGWDEDFGSRVTSELFLRLNPVCSIVGLQTVTYQLYTHEGKRLSTNPALRQESFKRLIRKHRALFNAHPTMFSEFVYQHALVSYKVNQRWQALVNLCWAIKLSPHHGLSLFLSSLLKKLQPRIRSK